ncbi:hypothetical protein [Cerasicoccus frondis]|uniref:hypothetical protein n=1 Tax=Cerasicoccus frondis TaxID=490090 RepID=UPI0028525DEF|nr:hypothetical protein [Cerasicoccus frondis]
MNSTIFSMLALLLMPLCLLAQVRTWTDTQGRSFEGLLLGYDENEVRIERTSDKRQFKLPRNKLSAEDNAYLDLRTQEAALEELLADAPKSFDEAFEKTIDDRMPMLVFYLNAGGADEFNRLLARQLTNPDFQALIEDEAFIVVIRDKNVDLEGLLYRYGNNGKPCMAFVKDTRTYGLRNFEAMSSDRFVKVVKDMFKEYNQSNY